MAKSGAYIAPARLALAAVIAPLAAPTVFVLMTRDEFSAGEPGFAWVFGFGTAFAYLGLLVGGVPIVLTLRRLRLLNLVGLTIAGAIAGIVVFQVASFMFAFSLGSGVGHDVLAVVYGAIAGASVSCCFGLIAGMANLKSETSADRE